MSLSSDNIIKIIKEKLDSTNPSKKSVQKRISMPDDNIKKNIYKNLNEGTVLNFIRNSSKRDILKSNISENSQEMKYDLGMINKYEEEPNSSLSFISEFNLEEDENESETFNSSLDDNSVEEFEIMKRHTTEGARIVHEILEETDDLEFRIIAENVAHYHHECWDGSRYPDGLKGEDIPLEARVMAIADVIDATIRFLTK